MAEGANNRRPDALEERARLLAAEAGLDPDARVPHASKPGRTQPLWIDWRDAARAAMTAERQAVAATEIASLRPQGEQYRDSPLVVLGDHEDSTVAQMRNCMGVGNAVAGVVCADGHLGYAQPVGGVIAYDGQISVSGVGFDIGCGNMAVRLDTPFDAIKDRMAPILADIRRSVSFGVGRANDERVEHPLLDDDEAWRASGMEDYRQKARAQLGTVGSGNHYVDLMADEEGWVWIGVHFGSRGLGHTSATRYLKLGGGKDGIHVPPTVLDEGSDLGRGYLAAMDLAGRYAYAGREWVVERVRRIIGGAVTDSVHNHHNFCVAGDQIVPTVNGPARMRDLSENEVIHAFDPAAGFVETKVLRHWKSGRKPILRIRTFSRSIRVSADHPLQVIEVSEGIHPDRPWHGKRQGRLAWKKAGEISKGDIVVCAQGYYEGRPMEGWSPGMARFVGAFLGDGWTRSDPTKQGHTVGLAIGGKGEAHTRDYLALMRSLFPGVEWRDNRSGEFGITAADKATHSLLCDLGINGTSDEKRVPREAFALETSLKLALLSGYFDADGTVADEGTTNHGRGTICSVNRQLVEELREIAISCGLRVTPVRREERTTNYGRCTAFSCVLAASSMALLLLWHRAKAGNLCDADRNGHPALAAGKIGHLTLPPGTFAQTVQSIEPDGEEDVFDITVAHPTHSFVCEGLVVHNCWKENHGGRDLWVVRKGATPAFPGQRGFVGGSMGDDAVILEGIESEASKAALYSTVHGAGRVFGRKEAKRRFTRQQMDGWLRERGVQLLGGDLDESPMAYRRLPEVLAHHAGTVRVRHTLRPFGVVMAGEGEFDPFKD